MTVTPLSIQEAMEQGKKLPFALIHCMSSMTLGETPKDCSMDELVEARFFSSEKEVHIFWSDGQWHGILRRQDEGDLNVLKTYPLKNRKYGATITVCQHLNIDDDGQVYVAATRLSGWKGGVNCGSYHSCTL